MALATSKSITLGTPHGSSRLYAEGELQASDGAFLDSHERWSHSDRLPEAIIEKDFPFTLLNFPAEHLVGRPSGETSLTKVDESEGVPGSLCNEVSGRLVEFGNSNTLADGVLDANKDEVFADPAKPILRIGKVGLSPVHQSVPIAPGAGSNFLADFVRFVEVVVKQPNTRQAGCRHIGVYYCVRCERYINRERREGGLDRLVGTTRIKWAEPLFPKKFGEYWAVGVGVKGKFSRNVHQGHLVRKEHGSK